MSNNLLNEEQITLDMLRKYFHENDFSTMPVKALSEYTEDEVKLYNAVLKHINAE